MVRKIDSMEKGVIFADLEQFVIVPERPRLWDLKNPGWSVNKSKHNRFVITPNGYGLSIFTTLPLLTFGTILTLIGILFILLSIAIRSNLVNSVIVLIIGILLLILCLLARRSELCIDLNKGYFVWRYANWPRFRSWRYKLSKPFNFKIKRSENFGSDGYYITVMTEDQKEEVLIFFFCDQSPREEYPIIVKTLEDSLGLRKLFDSAENR